MEQAGLKHATGARRHSGISSYHADRYCTRKIEELAGCLCGRDEGECYSPSHDLHGYFRSVRYGTPGSHFSNARIPASTVGAYWDWALSFLSRLSSLGCRENEFTNVLMRRSRKNRPHVSACSHRDSRFLPYPRNSFLYSYVYRALDRRFPPSYGCCMGSSHHLVHRRHSSAR
jgi:hypothetical protein